MIALKHRQPDAIDIDLAAGNQHAIASGATNGISHKELSPMKALTIHQPWAWAIAAGHKRVENRVWYTNYRGPLAIHAGKSTAWDAAGREFLAELGIAVPTELPRGLIIATCTLVDCIAYDQQPTYEIVPGRTLADDPFASGPFCWILADVELLDEQIPTIGKQKLWNCVIQLRKCLVQSTKQ